MIKELRIEIIKVAIDHINEWNLNTYLHDYFRAYIYNEEGNYLIGGKNVSEFIDSITTALLKQYD